MIRALLCGYPTNVRARKIMVALQGFVDDSASETGDRRFFLAGYVNTAAKWAEFADQWDRVLRAHPSIAYCKMAEAQNLRGQFAKWSAEKRDAKINALAAVVRAHSPWSVHASVSRKDYGAIIAPVAPFPLQHPYSACFWGILSAASHGHREFGMEPLPVDFVLDEQNGLEDVAVTTYRWLRDSTDQEMRDLLGATPVFRNDKKMVPLQAADMLAWHIRRAHERGGHENRVTTEVLLGNHIAIDVDVAALERIAAGFRRVPGVQFVRDKKSWRELHRVMREQAAAGPPPPKVSYFRMNIVSIMVRGRLPETRLKRDLHKLRRRLFR